MATLCRQCGTAQADPAPARCIACGSPRIGAVQHDEVEITPGSELHSAMTAYCEQAHVGAAALSRAEQAPEPVVGDHRQRRASPRSDRAGATHEFAARIEE